MPYKFNDYIPEQGDLIYINFDPSVGREIHKRRPAIVISSTTFNYKTGYVAVCPITSTIRNNPIYVNLHSHKLKGQIISVQFKTLDFTSNERNIQFVEKCNPLDFMKTAKIVNDGLGFDRIINNL
ncbi:type II toxin-antitoxin system PemK/MazF family toxin [Companilactobacillus jidongensis]|uniref:type II toxin-antitoxin system PemK/MazF family toxin n=1 Tax=Companilactobacillus jidongensis TaxID=2486006 RepID=UPI000F7969A4|nr:type II toxin-antitoxin system PemK/MazF family toxin [Companilactobacillus jidongensis]